MANKNWDDDTMADADSVPTIQWIEMAGFITTNIAKVSYTDATKVGYLTVTQAVDLDTMESDTATNNDKISYTDATDVGLNTTHRGLTNNPHSVDKTDVVLGNVPNIDCTNASNIAKKQFEIIITKEV